MNKFRLVDDITAYTMVTHVITTQQRADETPYAIGCARGHLGGPTQVVVEIGSRGGGSLCLLSRLLSDSGTLVSIEPAPVVRIEVDAVSEFITPIELIHIRLYSQDAEAALEEVLHGRGIDVLFIDGDHRYPAVKSDYEMYSPMMNSPGVILLHDLRMNGPALLWSTIKDDHPNEVVSADDDVYGIGILYT